MLTPIRENPMYLPIQICDVLPGQSAMKKLSADQTRKMIEVACRAPNLNAQSIVTDGVRLLGFGGTDGALVRLISPFPLVSLQVLTFLDQVWCIRRDKDDYGPRTCPQCSESEVQERHLAIERQMEHGRSNVCVRINHARLVDLHGLTRLQYGIPPRCAE